MWLDSLAPVQKIIPIYYFITPDNASGDGQAHSPLLTLSELCPVLEKCQLNQELCAVFLWCMSAEQAEHSPAFSLGVMQSTGMISKHTVFCAS